MCMSKKGYNIMDDFIWGLLTEHAPWLWNFNTSSPQRETEKQNGKKLRASEARGGHRMFVYNLKVRSHKHALKKGQYFPNNRKTKCALQIQRTLLFCVLQNMGSGVLYVTLLVHRHTCTEIQAVHTSAHEEYYMILLHYSW